MKQIWLMWFAPLVAAVLLSLVDCGGGSYSGIGASSGNGVSSGSGSGGTTGTATSGTLTAAAGTTAGGGASGTVEVGSGATSGTIGETGTTAASGTLAISGSVGGSGGIIGSTTDAGGPNDPCTNGTYRCVGAQLCDPALGCVQCESNANCPPPGAANAGAKVCVLGSCEVCGTNADCAAGEVCYPSNHTCHTSCVADAGACAAGGRTPICDQATGACVGCVTATDCTARDPVCDPTTQQCAQCVANADCKGNAMGAVCDTASDTCVACLANTDCPAARPICNAVAHVCIAACTTNASCAARGGPGGPGGFGGMGAMTPICDTATGLCVECTTAAQCTGVNPTCTNSMCSTCNADSDCSVDGGGATPYCEGTRCVACVNRSQCPATALACINGACVP